jgi:hypothetical protein
LITGQRQVQNRTSSRLRALYTHHRVLLKESIRMYFHFRSATAALSSAAKIIKFPRSLSASYSGTRTSFCRLSTSESLFWDLFGRKDIVQSWCWYGKWQTGARTCRTSESHMPVNGVKDLSWQRDQISSTRCQPCRSNFGAQPPPINFIPSFQE